MPIAINPIHMKRSPQGKSHSSAELKRECRSNHGMFDWMLSVLFVCLCVFMCVCVDVVFNCFTKKKTINLFSMTLGHSKSSGEFVLCTDKILKGTFSINKKTKPATWMVLMHILLSVYVAVGARFYFLFMLHCRASIHKKQSALALDIPSALY